MSFFNAHAQNYFSPAARNFTPDRMVKLRSDGRKLDDAMSHLQRINNEPLSNERIVKALSKAGIASAAEDIRRSVVDGETFVIRKQLFGNCASETAVEVKRFEMGFHYSESKKTGRI